MATKEEIIQVLTDAGIKHDPTDPKDKLAALVPINAPVVEVDPNSREARWAIFLAKAREVNPVRFDAQKANKEFDTIPNSFQ